MAIITASDRAMNQLSLVINRLSKGAVTTCSVVMPCLLSVGVMAEEWKIEPSVKVGTIYSDNINLEANAQSDVVLEVSPGISLGRETRRLSVNLDYNLQNLQYQDNSDLNTSNHQLSSDLNAELLADTLFVDLGSSFSQQLTNRRASGSSDGISGSGNLSDVFSYSVSPYWQQRLGDIADFELRYTYDTVKSDSSVGGGDDSDSNGISFDIENGPATGRINWLVGYDTQQVRYDDGGKSDTESANARIGYQLTRTLNTFISGTYENNDFSGNRGDAQPDDSTSGAGFTWAPSQDFVLTTLYNKRLDPRPDEDETFISGDVFWAPTARTDISIGYDNSFFGETYNGNVSHRTRWTRWNLDYSEGTSDFRSNFFEALQAVCPSTAVAPGECRVLVAGDTGRPGEVPFRSLFPNISIVRSSISDDTFINKTGRASVSIVGARNTVSLTVTDTKRIFVADNDMEKDSSIDLSWTYQFAPRTDSRVTLGHTQEQFDDGQEDDFMSYAWRVTRQISNSSIFYVEAQVSERDSAVSTSRYEENRLTVSLQKFF